MKANRRQFYFFESDFKHHTYARIQRIRIDTFVLHTLYVIYYYRPRLNNEKKNRQPETTCVNLSACRAPATTKKELSTANAATCYSTLLAAILSKGLQL